MTDVAISDRARTATGGLCATGLIASVITANWLTTRYGFIPIGLGQQATAGTLAAGFALALRDGVQDTLGKLGTLAVILAACAVSYLIAAPAIAIASAVAFLVAELCDFAVYTPLRRRSRLGDRRWAGAVTASGVVGAVVDTVVFLGLAFGWAAVAPAIIGQLLGKLWATLMYLIIGKVVARWNR